MSENNSKVKEALRIVEKEWNKVIKIIAVDVIDGLEREFSYKYEKVIGNGSFGIVCEVIDVKSNETLAIKKVFQDRGYQNRELQIIKTLSHPNVVALRKYYYSKDESVCCFLISKNEGDYLNLVLEYIPSTIYRSIRNYTRSRQYMPMFLVKVKCALIEKLYTFQLLKSLRYIHSYGICHRDIKPQNLLVNTQTGELKLCDFGSAKRLTPGEDNVSYICSRYYRAPEVIFGSSQYTVSIDIWSAGCVLAEMLIGKPFFVGKSSVDQLVEIIKIMGTPTREQVESMNQNYSDFNFPDIKPQNLSKIFPPRVEPEALDLLKQLLQYNPKTRITAADALGHAFFAELKAPGTKLLNGNNLPSHLLED